jgi:protoporphyrinogen/coproporphyrinogen III oxidase
VGDGESALTETASRARVAIVGAGIAGLTAAYRIKQAGHTPVVIEAADYVGGRIKSVRRGDFLFDIGAFIYLGSYLESIDLMREVGLGARMGRYKAYGAMPRDGKLNFLDLERPVRTILGTGYISAGGKLKLLKLMALLLRHWKDLNYDDASGISVVDEDSVQSYAERELGQELLDYVASVVVRGPWLIPPDRSSVAQLLWTMKNFFKPYFYGLDDGMDALPRALAAGLDVRLDSPVAKVVEHADAAEVTWRDQGREVTERFDACIITTTTDITLKIFPQVRGFAREFFEATDYISSVNTHLALRTRPANPATYIMCSTREQKDMSGVIVDHLKASGRVPAGKGMLTVFCNDAWCKANLDTPDQVVIDQVLGFVKPYYGDLSDQVEDAMIGRWERVVPIMAQGRFKQAARYQAECDPRARVQIAGDLVPMGGVNAALVSGDKTGRAIAALLG